MSVNSQNWYDLNSSRRYPLGDLATTTGDDDERLPDNILADLHVRFPNTIGSYAFISSITVTDTIATVTLLACDDVDSPSGYIPLAAVSVPKPVAGRAYKLNPFSDGVGGWIVFGEGIRTPFVGRFSSPTQTLLLPKMAKPYQLPPVSSARKLHAATKLHDVVTLKAGNDVYITKKQVTIDSIERDVIAIGLKENCDPDCNVFEKYSGKCGRPESGTCARPGITDINCIQPNCAGDFILSFVITGTTPNIGYANTVGAMLIQDIILQQLFFFCLCKNKLPSGDGDLRDAADMCQAAVAACIPYVNTFDAEASIWASVEGEPNGQNVDDWSVELGTFELHVDDFPIGGYSYVATSLSTFNASVWCGCVLDSVITGIIVQCVVKVPSTDAEPAAGSRNNAFILLNYDINTDLTHGVGIDLNMPALIVFKTSPFTVLAATPVSLQFDTWYKLEAIVQTEGFGDDPQITGNLFCIGDDNLDSLLATVTTAAPGYNPQDGCYGLGSDRSYARFASFAIPEITPCLPYVNTFDSGDFNNPEFTDWSQTPANSFAFSADDYPGGGFSITPNGSAFPCAAIWCGCLSASGLSFVVRSRIKLTLGNNFAGIILDLTGSGPAYSVAFGDIGDGTVILILTVYSGPLLDFEVSSTPTPGDWHILEATVVLSGGTATIEGKLYTLGEVLLATVSSSGLAYAGDGCIGVGQDAGPAEAFFADFTVT